MPENDTIAAVATARGRAALAIIRMSGPEAVAIASRVFRGDDLRTAASHTVHVGYVTSTDGADLDQVVVTLFLAPRSVTGEDVVEISCHGGDFAPRLVLNRLLEAGARLADPGEFTHRAFINGKMDLAQAEAVADLIHASSSMAHRVSVSHLQGRYSEVLTQLREELLELCAFLELELDFAEEDVEFADRERLETLLRRSRTLLEELLQSYRLGARLRDGVRVVIGGRPNAGKSTLLNALLGRDRAIVSATPGTTRDEIEDEVELAGVLFRFVDTAGLRETSDAIEAEGVRRAERSIEHADVLVYVYDVTVGLDAAERAFVERAATSLPVIIVANKRDLVAAEAVVPRDSAADPHESATGSRESATASRESATASRESATASRERASERADADVSVQSSGDSVADRAGDAPIGFRGDGPPAPPVLHVSARRGFSDENEIRPLTERLLATVGEHLSEADASHVVVNQRHRQHLEHALDAVRRAGDALHGGASGDTLALDLRAALHELGAITGEITNEDVLDQIFSRFCIGK